ncbi:hypothetical protein AN286_02650 [Aliarcobacter cryaerophilus ATCC 43158]|uniref:Uncharacterized protein n=1 Tax=Aliarcobacter cryaerophilus ATCC 43158 TaxID=1032070 RepID=A0AAD0XB32_9BACT|nr:hypothetical protein [Aliarcobacter cryaerophilus]AYJ81037.1 hypothetical protein ACRYA_1948 [Aliarcobacter cryaerophilus ATCC 43158]PRM96489.1 hypothetical protein CJ667_07620 [Aliarcobacter cryaerophilus]QCZ23355.1 hypothetical protein AN286_02650 [Aliarcobacter cryaerophilus ATCC 43158]
MSKLIELNSEVEIYIKALQNNKQYKKSFAFIDYCLCLKNGDHYSTRENAKRCNISSTTAHEWKKDYETIIDNIECRDE